jgi:hypothetical protein
MSVREASVSLNDEGTAIRKYGEFDTVQRLIAAGMNDCEIARRTAVPRATVRDWRCRPPAKLRNFADTSCGVIHQHAALSTASASPGHGQQNTSSRSTARQPPRVSTSSSVPSAERHSLMNP